MSNAYIGYGATLECADGSSAAYVTFPRLESIDLPGHEREQIESTALDSPDETKEFLPGFKDSGEFSVTQQYEKARMTRIFALDGVTKNWRVTFPDGGKGVFSGFVKKFDRNIEKAAIIGIKFTIKVTGDEAWSES